MFIAFDEAKTNLEKKAYDWAIKEQERMGCMAEPMALDFVSDTVTTDHNNVVVSIFYDHNTNEAILRRDWLNSMGIKYNILTNFSEMRKSAPKSVAHMVNNGVKLYRYYDGQNGGVTRKVKKEWV